MMSLIHAFALLALCVLCSSAQEFTPFCGTVLDGSSKGVDQALQFSSVSTISAQWSGFEDGRERNRVLRYEWSIISSKQFSSKMSSNECRMEAGFYGQPDMMVWTNVNKQTLVTSKNLKLEVGQTYYVVLRITNSFGYQFFANSDGVTIIDDIEEPAKLVQKRDSAEYYSYLFSEGDSLVFDFNLDCPIDAANRCAQSKNRVSDLLTSIYGPAVYSHPSTIPGSGPDIGGSDEAVFKTPQLGTYGYPIAQTPQQAIRKVVYVHTNLNTGSAIGLALGVCAFFFVLFALIVVLSSIVHHFLFSEDDGGSGSPDDMEH